MRRVEKRNSRFFKMVLCCGSGGGGEDVVDEVTGLLSRSSWEDRLSLVDDRVS